MLPASITVHGGGSVSLDGDAMDPEGDRLTYAWASNGGGRFANAAALDTMWTAPAKTNAEQDITLTLTVTDNGAGTLADTAAVGVTVRANEAPDASLSPTSATVNGGGSVALDGSASDADDSALTYRWTSSGGGTFANARALDTTWTAPAATSIEQSITLTLTATDATMASDTATVQMTVRANQPPEVRVAPGERHRRRWQQADAGRDGDRSRGRPPDLRMDQLGRRFLRQRLGPRHDLDCAGSLRGRAKHRPHPHGHRRRRRLRDGDRRRHRAGAQ